METMQRNASFRVERHANAGGLWPGKGQQSHRGRKEGKGKTGLQTTLQTLELRASNKRQKKLTCTNRRGALVLKNQVERHGTDTGKAQSGSINSAAGHI